MRPYFEPPEFADPKEEPWRTQIVLAGLQSGHYGTARLALQLAGIKHCDKCDFVKDHCRCEKPK